MTPDPSPAYSAGYILGAFVGGLVAIGLLILFVIAIIQAINKRSKGWIITSVITGILGLGLVGTGVVIGMSAIIKKAANDAKIEQKLTSKDERFTIVVPNGWDVMPELHEDADLAAGNGSLEQYGIVLVESKAELKMDLPAYAKLIMDSMKERVNGTPGPLENTIIQEKPAIRSRLVGKVDGIDIVYQCHFVETPDSLCQILCWTLPRNESRAFPIFTKVAASFKQIAPANPVPAAPAAAATDSASKTKTPLARIEAILIEHLKEPAQPITPSSRLVEDLKASETDKLEVIMAVEDAFSIQITDAEAALWKNVGDIQKFVEARLAAPPPKEE